MTSTTTDRLAGVTAGLSSKAPVRAATTANITLSGEQTIDAVAVVADDRVLVKNQTDGTENGIYDAKSGAWVRSLDFDGTRDVVSGTFVVVSEGTAGAGTLWYLSTTGDITVGTTSLTFTLMTIESASAFILTLLDDANAAAARATLDAAALTVANTFTKTQTWAKGADIASADPLVIGADGNIFDVTGTTNFTSMTVAAGTWFWLQFDGILTITHGASLSISGGVNVTTAAGDRMLCVATAANTVEAFIMRSSGETTTTPLPRGFISGFVVTNNATDAAKDVDISIGAARNAADTVNLTTSAAFGKQGDVAFAKGGTPGTPVGGLGNTVSLPTSGTIHIHAITEDSSGDVDFYLDTDASGANTPAGWTFRKRVHSLRTDATPDILAVSVTEIAGGGLKNVWSNPDDTDFASPYNNPGATEQTETLIVPTGIQVDAIVQISLFDTTPAGSVRFHAWPPDITVTAVPGTNNATLTTDAAAEIASVNTNIMTDTSGQIKWRLSSSDVDITVRFGTHGWIDYRR